MKTANLFDSIFGETGLMGNIFGAKEESKPQTIEDRVLELEKHVDNLSMAVLVLLNSADKKSQASIPSSVANSKPKIYIETKSHPDKKFIRIVTIRAEIPK